MKNKKTFLKLSAVCLLIAVFIFGSFNLVGAQTTPKGGEKVTDGTTVNLTNPLSCNTVQECLGSIIRSLLGIIGSLSLVMFIYGGFTWMLSGGNEQQVKKGKGIFTWSVLGLLVVFTSYAILKFVFQALQIK